MIILLTIMTYLAFVALIVIGVISGMHRGFGSSLVRLACTTILLPIAYFLGIMLANPIADSLMSALNGLDGWFGILVENISESVNMLRQIVRALLTPALFAIIFGLLEALTLIRFKDISLKIVHVTGNTHKASQHSKLLGGLVGLTQGAVVAIILTIPLCMCTTLMSASSPEALAALGIPGFDGRSEAAACERSPVELLPSNSILYPMTVVQDSAIPNTYAELRGQRLCAMHEAPNLINAFGNGKKAYHLYLGQNENELNAMLRALGAVNTAKGDSQVLPIALAHIVRATAEVLCTSEDMQAQLGLNTPGSSDISHLLLSDILDIMKSATADNVSPMIQALAGDGYSMAAVEGLLKLKDNTSAGETIKDNSQLVSDILLKLGESNELREVNDNIHGVISDYIVSADTPLLSDKVSDADKKQLFINVSDQIQQLLSNSSIDTIANYAEQVSEISGIISHYAQSYGYEISDSEITIAAVGVLSYCQTSSDVSPESIMEYIGMSAEDIARILAAQ